ncbi:MAG: hypothetical protein AAFX39_11980 [Pseudomonadota bacterium]
MDHPEFVFFAIRKLGSTEGGFAALVRLLTTFGSHLMPDALIELHTAWKRSPVNLLKESYVRSDLETLLRNVVYRHSVELGNRVALKKACLEFLDQLVDRGSSFAFQLREFAVSPIRAA